MNVREQMLEYGLPTYARYPLVPVKGRGAYLWDEEGKKYLDFCSGVAVCSLGHCAPVMVDALVKQAQELIHASNLFYIPQQAALAQCIVECVELPGKVFFSNSGAEANDGLIKMARRFGHARRNASGAARYEVITFEKSFHGRTLGSMAATGQTKLHEGYDPLLTGFKYCPFNDLAALENMVSDVTAAIMLEPLQGEGGVNEASAEFIRGVKENCERHDLLLFFDEVQAGFGRCGTMMAWRAITPEIVPDGISWAKGMGGGFPIGAFWISDREINAQGVRLSSLMGPGSHGSTYGGSPLACAVSLAVIEEIKRANVCENVLAREAQVRALFAEWKQDIFTGIRGRGLLLGFSLNAEKIPAVEGKTAAQVMLGKLMELGLLTVPAGPETLRWLPPLNVTAEEIELGFTTMKKAVAAL